MPLALRQPDKTITDIQAKRSCLPKTPPP